jgi:hypothetical protein
VRQPCGKHAQLDPHGPAGKSAPRPDASLRPGAATMDSNLLNFELPHCGHSGGGPERTNSSAC